MYLTPTAAELTSRRTFACVLCGRATANPPALRRHLNAHGTAGARELEAADAATAAAAAAAAAAGGPRLSRYFCPAADCPHHPGPGGGGDGAVPFKTLRNAREHFSHAHDDAQAAHACARCGRCYKERRRLLVHERRCGTRHRCSCGAWYAEKRSLRKHLAIYGDHADAGSVDADGRDLPQPGDGQEEEDDDDDDEAAAAGEELAADR